MSGPTSFWPPKDPENHDQYTLTMARGAETLYYCGGKELWTEFEGMAIHMDARDVNTLRKEFMELECKQPTIAPRLMG